MKKPKRYTKVRSEGRPALSPKQRETLDAIRRVRDQNGITPTQRELGVALGVSQTAIRQRISVLVRKGYLLSFPRSARGAIVVD